MMVPLKTKLDIWDPIFKGTNVLDFLCLPRTLAPWIFRYLIFPELAPIQTYYDVSKFKSKFEDPKT